MSLQVWLPLTKDLRNQGLAINYNFILGSATLDNSGKLGKCYNFTSTTSNGMSLSGSTENFMNTYINNHSWSLCAWVNTSVNNGDTCVFGMTYGLRFYAGSNTHVSLYNSSRTIDCTSSVGTGDGKWHHIVATYNVNTNEIKIYVDGINTGNATYTSGYTYSSSWTNTIVLGRDPNNSTANAHYWYSGKLNDVRIYDHTLSPMEVKLISQGLVLHYSFSDDNLESTTNLVTREDGLSDTCYNGATSKYGYGTNTDIYKTVGTFQNRKSTKIYMGTAGLNAYPYIYFDTFNAAGAVIQTLSFDYYPTFQNTIIPYSYNGAYNFSYTTNKTSGSASNVSQITIPVEVGRWNHITVTAQKTDTTNTSRGIGYIRIGSASHTSATTNYWLFSNVQVEAKNHATGYAGVGGTRNSTIVYDCSGFVNNGTINGALTISNDTPKYSVSTYMPKAALITHPRPVFGGIDQEWSCAVWFKLDNTSQTSQYLNNFNTGNIILASTTPLLYLNSGANDYYMYGKKTINANEWTHIVFVFRNSNALRNVYVNGELSNNYGPNKTSTPSGIQDIITIGSNLAGYISDYRIYATALSADDVKSLYQNCATIDPDGTIRGQIRS